MNKRIFLLAIFLAMKVASDDFFYNTPNNHGSLGIINLPSARFYESPAGTLSFYRGAPDRKIILTLYPYDWFEASVFYASIKDEPYGNGFSQDYKDKGFNVKFRLKEQDQYPAVAIGVNDIAGTGLYSSEYIVSSYSYDRFDFTLGAGWGRLNEFNNTKNPLIYLSDRFINRSSSINQGGDFRFDDFFSGSDISIFGGINYAPNNQLVLKLEYDPTQTSGRIKYEDRKSDISFGINYLTHNYMLGFNYERGSNVSFNLSYRDNFFAKEHEYKTIKNKTNNYYDNLIKILQLNEVGISNIKKENDKVAISVTQFKHEYEQLNKILEEGIKDSGLTEEVLISYKIAGLEVIKSSDLSEAEIVYINSYKGFSDNLSLKLRPFIASREDFLKVALLLEYDFEYIFSENLFFSSNLKLSLIDNFDDLFFPPVDVYPEQVRSDIKKYLNNIGEKPTIGRAQIEYFKTIGQNNHFLLSGGIYEEMFSGYGLEYLNYNPSRKLNIGFEVHKAFKRDYDFGFGLLGYKNITYHLNAYYKNRKIIPFDVKLSHGEYLAGDKGFTIDLSRSFNNGVRFGVFASFTNVSKDQYGEGSFDKGIYFSIPFWPNRKFTNILWRPLTKDPASKLIRKNDIYNLVDRYNLINN